MNTTNVVSFAVLSIACRSSDHDRRLRLRWLSDALGELSARERQIATADLVPGDVLLDAAGYARLADVGFARREAALTHAQEAVDIRRELAARRPDAFRTCLVLTGQHRDNVLVLYGQRRTGKTSVLYQMSRRLDRRYLCVFVDLHGLALAAADRRQ